MEEMAQEKWFVRRCFKASYHMWPYERAQKRTVLEHQRLCVCVRLCYCVLMARGMWNLPARNLSHFVCVLPFNLFLDVSALLTAWKTFLRQKSVRLLAHQRVCKAFLQLPSQLDAPSFPSVTVTCHFWLSKLLKHVKRH